MSDKTEFIRHNITMIKTVYWNNIEIHNMSAEVEIPDDIVAEGKDAVIDYLHDNEDSLQKLETEDDIEIIESFDNLNVAWEL